MKKIISLLPFKAKKAVNMKSPLRSLGKKAVNSSRFPFAALAAITAVSYVRNRLMPLYADDYAYSFIWDGKHRGNLMIPPDQPLKRVRSLRDVAVSQFSHYMTWGGRTVAHTLDQLLLMDGKRTFNYLNTAVILSQILLCARMGLGKKKAPDDRMLAWLGSCFWFCTPHLGGTTEWMTGALNYLWMGVLQSVFTLPYSMRVADPKYRMSKALMVFLGLLAGWSNEAGAGAAGFYSGLSTMRSILRKEKNTGWMVAGLLGCGAGMGAMLFAPGNKKRIELTEEYYPIEEDTDEDENEDRAPLDQYLKPAMFKHHFRYGFLRTVLRELPAQLPVFLYFTRAGKRERLATENILMLEAAALAVPVAMMFSPEFPVRAAYPSVIFSLAASAAASGRLISSALPGWVRPLCGVFAVQTAVSVAAGLGVDYSIYRQEKERRSVIEDAAEGDSVTLKLYQLPKILSFLAGDRSFDAYSLTVDLDLIPEDSYNSLMARYFHLKEIRGYDPDQNGMTGTDRKGE